MDDSAYWNRFYQAAHPDLEAPSSFAHHVAARLRPGMKVFELGCGNGRDALFFAASGLQVIACDTSAVAIETLNTRAASAGFTHLPRFVVADMAALGEAASGLEVVYSRFTLHAVPAAIASSALAWAFQALQPGGRLFVEARTVLGSLYLQGDPVPGERDAFIHDGHYRRFLRRDELEAELGGLGFQMREVTEQSGVAVYKDDDPVVVRIDAEKPRAS